MLILVSPCIHVAVGVITDSDGKILLSKRANDAHQGGLWEFPGGKLEQGELNFDALVRELREELGIEVSEAQGLIKIRHQYADKSVLLDVMKISKYSGEARGLEGQPLSWVEPAEIFNTDDSAYTLPEANAGIIKALKIPGSMMITGNFPTSEIFFSKLEASLVAGLKLVQLRVEDLRKVDSNLILESKKRCESFGAKLILNSRNSNDFKESVDGFHLTTKELMACHSRPLGSDFIVGASCHSMQELDKAMDIDVDYVTISPVLPTKSHPEAEALGWEKFEFLADQAKIPIYALGGITEDKLNLVKQLGGHGIAAIGEFWD